jgi:predicted RNA-binding Zn ribbon-like protein
MPTLHSDHDAAHPVDHAHVADLETCLDLINTVELTDGVPEDHTPTDAAVIAWLVEKGIAHEDAVAAQADATPDRWLARFRGARAALREVWDAAVEGRAADGSALDTVNELLSRAPHPRLHGAPDGVVVGHRHDPADPTGEALARIASPLVASLEAGDTARFRVCANDGCRWVFEDTSRGGRRRWCDMNTCGNRAKVRRFRSRRRAPDEAPPAETEGGQPRSSSGFTSVANRTIDSSS